MAVKKKAEPEYKGSGYLTYYLKPKNGRKYIAKTLKFLNKHLGEFDTIAYTGMSGALFAPEIARTLDKHLIMVRKTTRSCHSSHLVEGNPDCKKYVIVDDFISTGITVETIQKKIHKFAPNAECIGAVVMDEIKFNKDHLIKFKPKKEEFFHD